MMKAGDPEITTPRVATPEADSFPTFPWALGA